MNGPKEKILNEVELGEWFEKCAEAFDRVRVEGHVSIPEWWCGLMGAALVLIREDQLSRHQTVMLLGTLKEIFAVVPWAVRREALQKWNFSEWKIPDRCPEDL